MPTENISVTRIIVEELPEAHEHAGDHVAIKFHLSRPMTSQSSKEALLDLLGDVPGAVMADIRVMGNCVSGAIPVDGAEAAADALKKALEPLPARLDAIHQAWEERKNQLQKAHTAASRVFGLKHD